MIEINSSVHSNLPLLAQLQEIRDTLVQAGDQLNIGICGGGTHPFQHWSEQKIFEKPRFGSCRSCMATWPSSSPSSASTCTSAALRATMRCSCCIR
jgi:gamma-glutamyl:cysteine ligase YbdK (ATP-grasp superfamily)